MRHTDLGILSMKEIHVMDVEKYDYYTYTHSCIHWGGQENKIKLTNKWQWLGNTLGQRILRV